MCMKNFQWSTVNLYINSTVPFEKLVEKLVIQIRMKNLWYKAKYFSLSCAKYCRENSFTPTFSQIFDKHWIAIYNDLFESGKDTAWTQLLYVFMTDEIFRLKSLSNLPTWRFQSNTQITFLFIVCTLKYLFSTTVLIS